MRYDDWDILLFPSSRESQDAKVPMKEFRVACHVIPDVETSHSQASQAMPIMTCFIPSLPAGNPFHISVHSWRTPEISQFTKNYSKHPESVKFEARFLIDGRVVASTAFDRQGSWPYLITSTFEFTKSGELEPFRFPQFRRELLYHNHWHPADDIGRVKIIISEGFPRDSPSNPIERVKNIVAFSFQHAPLDILESNGIAWPNPQMWRRSPAGDALPVPAYRSEDGAESHSHSPRRQSFIMRGKTTQSLPVPQLGTLPASTSIPGLVTNPMFNQNLLPVLPQGVGGLSSSSLASSALAGSALGGSSATVADPYNDAAAYIEWCTSMGKSAWNPDLRAIWDMNVRSMSKHSSTDTSMPDYSSSSNAPHALDGLQMPVAPMLDEDFTTAHLKVPTNTPTNGLSDGLSSNNTSFSFSLPGSAIPGDLAASLTHSLLSQPHPLPVQPHLIPLPASEVKSRKENRHLNVETGSSGNPSPDQQQLHEKRDFSQPVFSVINASFAPTVGTSSRVPSTSPSDMPIFSAGAGSVPSRPGSTGEFGSNITNMVEPLPTAAAAAAAAAGSALAATFGGVPGGFDRIGGADSGTVMDNKGVKRTRTFTPASTKVIDEEDEPRRVSPRLRIGSFAGEGRVGEK